MRIVHPIAFHYFCTTKKQYKQKEAPQRERDDK